jgi:phospholipid/cholesterol/gamma-HCH transport system ATP-binding protein
LLDQDCLAANVLLMAVRWLLFMALHLSEPQTPPRPLGAMDTTRHPAIAVAFDRVSLSFDDDVVLRDVSFTLETGALKVLLGPSGSGKSVILKLILGLLKPDGGTIHLNGERIDQLSETKLLKVRADIGMLFQEGALFDSLTVAENVGYRLYEETDMPAADVRRRVEEVLGFIGLREYIDQMPAELSGGQKRRVAIARAMASKPRLLLFDSPTSGLDPLTARTVDAEIIKLRDLEHVTALVVTHQIDDAFYIASHVAEYDGTGVRIVDATNLHAQEARFMLLRDGRIYFEGTSAELRTSQDPYIRRYLS